MKIYLVGGAVRDELLGLAVKERDFVVVGSSFEEMLEQGFEKVGKSFPVFLHPNTKEEYALARIERKVGPGYHGFTFDTSRFVTLEEDLLRRDLTINAMAKSEEGKIIDPYGGQQDLKARLLRHVSPAFSEDPVRVLRVARFAARYAPLGFKVAPETLALMQEMVTKGECDALQPERIWKEMSRALAEPAPVEFIRVLRQCQALRVILPELDALYGVVQALEHHPEKDTGIHTELVLIQATRLSVEPEVRFAALLHDVGKALTPVSELPKHPEHAAAGVALVKMLCQRLKVPTNFQELARLVTQYHSESYQAKGNSEKITALLEKCDAFRRPERFKQFLIATEADFRGRPGYEEQPFPQTQQYLKALQAAQNINVQAAINDALQGGHPIKKAIFQARIKAVAECLKRLE